MPPSPSKTSNFYKEGAFGVFGYIRAAIVDTRPSGGLYQGGSTTHYRRHIKNTLLNPTDRSFARRDQGVDPVGRDQPSSTQRAKILRFYLNEIPYGSNAYGIEGACKTYFPQDTVNNDLCAPQS